MAPVRFSAGWFVVLVFAGAIPALAQLSPPEPDPLARIRDAAKSNIVACSATGETLCEQVAPKIIANAQGDSPLGENARHLAQEIHDGKMNSSEEGVAWAMAAFRAAGLEPHPEEDSLPATGKDGSPRVQQAVFAELRGREKPDEWVVLGARLDSQKPDPVNTAGSVSLIVEAARDIQATAIHPRRSIRFVLFIGGGKDLLGSWAYVRAHREELGRICVAIFFSGGASRRTGYMLNGRQDIEGGVREAMKPIESWGAGHNVPYATISSDNFDFILEGVPTLLADQEGARSSHTVPAFSEALDTLDLQQLKRNSAIAAVTAFGIAERSDPLGPRQSRAEIESLLKATDLENEMTYSGLWPLWKSGQRGRVP
jgi:hypothetical protein